MRKKGYMLQKSGYLPKLVSRTHHTFFKLGRFEVFLCWNGTFLKLRYLMSVLKPSFETEQQRYGRDFVFGWLGGAIEISYINKTVSNNTRVPKEIPNDKRKRNRGISLYSGADLRI